MWCRISPYRARRHLPRAVLDDAIAAHRTFSVETRHPVEVGVAGRGEDRLLHLYRRLVQPGATAFCPRLPLAHGLRTGDGGPTNGSVINQARQHSTKTGQLQGPLGSLVISLRHCQTSVMAIPGKSPVPRKGPRSTPPGPVGACISENARASGNSYLHGHRRVSASRRQTKPFAARWGGRKRAHDSATDPQ